MNDLQGSSLNYDKGRLQSEIFYLIVKHLRSFPDLKSSADALESKLLHLGAFGMSFDWTGASKQMTTADIEKTYPMVAGDQLIQLLRRESFSTKETPHSTSLLRVNGIFDPSNAEHRKVYTDASKQLASLLTQLHEKIASSKKAKDLKLFIEKRLKNNFSDVHVEADAVIDVAIDLTHDEMDLSNDVVLYLKQIGSTKQVARLEKQIDDLELSNRSIQNQIRDIVAELTVLGCRVAPVSRNHVDSTIGFLRARDCGFTSLRPESRGRIGYSAAPSVVVIRNRLLANYKLLYTISGHMMNPAYCCVFDHTGNFVITGADDYLVKIWDVNNGNLVRTCRGHMAYISIIAVSPDNSLFASSCTSGSIRVWRLSDGICLTVLQHKAMVNWMKFDPSSCTLASGSDDGHCIVWDLSKCLSPDCTAIPLLDKLLVQKNKGRRIYPSQTGASIDVCSPSDEIRSIVFRPFVGLYDWSTEKEALSSLTESPIVHENSRSMLPLPHVSERLPHLSSLNEPRRVLCLDIATVGNIMVTGCEDGVARVWKFGEIELCESLDVKYPLRQPRRPLESLLHQTKENCSAVDKPVWERFEKHLLMRLEGHAQPITDIHFNSLGDRVLTGSSKGGVRIWSLSKDYVESLQLVLDLAEEDEQQPMMMSRGMRRSNSGRWNLSVHNVCWTCNDLRVVTLQSVPSLGSGNDLTVPTRLKVFDSITGELLRIIRNVSSGPSKCLVPHPIEAHIIVTGGDDGIINVWDVDAEERLSQTKLDIIINDQNKCANIVDISIAPDGTKIAATDLFGRLTVIGLDDPLRYTKVLEEQYYSTDYADIILDDLGYAIDVGTQLPADRAPSGPLCTMHNLVHQIQPIITHRPQPLSDVEVDTLLLKTMEDRLRLPLEMERVHLMFARNERLKRVPRKYALRMGPAAVRSVNSPFRPTSQVASSSTGVRYIEFDELSSSNDSDDNSNNFDRMSNRRRRDQRVGIRNAGNGRIHTLQDLAETSSLRRSTRNRSNFSVFDDGNVMDEEVFESRASRHPTRAERAAARAAAREGRNSYRSGHMHTHYSDGSEFELVEDEEEDNVSDMMPSDDDERGTGRRAGRAVRHPRNRATSDNESSEVVGGGSSSGEQSMRDRKRKTKGTRTTAISRDDEVIPSSSRRGRKRQQGPDGSISMGLELERSWLQQDAPNEFIYSPQVGDLVVYFPQGHKEQLTHFTESTSPPWVMFGQKLPLYECMVQDISYEFPSEQEFRKCKSAVAKITLVVLRVPSRTTLTNQGSYLVNFMELRSTRHSSNKSFTFDVKLRDSGLADFVIPAAIFEKSIQLHWHQGVEIVAKFSERDEQGVSVLKDYFGRVERLSNSDPEWPHSPWEALEVIWHTAESPLSNTDIPPMTQRISPWDAMPRFSKSSFAQPALPKLEEELCIRWENAVKDLMEKKRERYSPFEYEVDSTVFPEYYSLIAVPSFVDLIRRRLLSGFYRQLPALEWDVHLLYLNCEIFNQQGSDIVSAACELRDDLLAIFKSPDPPVDFNESNELYPKIKRNIPKAQCREVTLVENQALKHLDAAEDEEVGDLKLRFKRRKMDHTNIPASLTIQISPRSSKDTDPKMKNHPNLESSDSESVNEESESSESDDCSYFSASSAEASNDKVKVEDQTKQSKTLMLRLSTRGSKNTANFRQLDIEKEHGVRELGYFDNLDEGGKRQKNSLKFDPQPRNRKVAAKGTKAGTKPTFDGRGRGRRQGHDGTSSIGKTETTMRRTRGARVSYVEKSSDDDEEDDDSPDEPPSKEKRPVRAITKSEVQFSNNTRKSGRVDPEIKRQMLDVLEFASSLDQNTQLFADPVDPEYAPNYYDIVETPMDLSLIRSNITSRRYETVQEVIRDVLVIYSNCELYNEIGSEIVRECRKQQRQFKQYVRSTYQFS